MFSLSLTAFASNAPSAQTKEEYYQEYLAIVSEMFRASISASAVEIAAAEFIVSDSETTEPIKGGISPQSTAIKTKTGSIANRQVFSGVSNVTSTSADAGL